MATRVSSIRPKPRPCRSCHKWFTPGKHCSDLQHYCSDSVCQRKRHAKNCASWRGADAEASAADRLSRRLTEPRPLQIVDKIAESNRSTTAGSAGGPPIEEDPKLADVFSELHKLGPKLRLEHLRDLVGLQTVVVFEVLQGLLRDWVRDSVAQQLAAQTEQSRKHAQPVRRDDVAQARSTA